MGVIPVHFIAGCFGMLSAGIFAKIDEFNVSEFAEDLRDKLFVRTK